MAKQMNSVEITPAQLRTMREAAYMTQEEAAKLVYQSGGRVWRRWEAGDRRINLAAAHLFAILTDQRFPPKEVR